LILASPKTLWQHRAMIEVRTLPDNHPDLVFKRRSGAARWNWTTITCFSWRSSS